LTLAAVGVLTCRKNPAAQGKGPKRGRWDEPIGNNCTQQRKTPEWALLMSNRGPGQTARMGGKRGIVQMAPLQQVKEEQKKQERANKQSILTGKVLSRQPQSGQCSERNARRRGAHRRFAGIWQKGWFGRNNNELLKAQAGVSGRLDRRPFEGPQK